MIELQEIKNILNELKFLLNIGEGIENEDYIRLVDSWISNIDQYQNDIIREILHSNGPCSFFDFYLYKNGEPLKKENQDFYNLKRKLYSLCIEALPELSKKKE